MVRILLSGISVQMNNKFRELEKLCRGYETETAPEFVLTVSYEEIREERAKQTADFSDGYLEAVCMYRKLALEMLRYGVFIMHASVIEVDGQGYAFLARSGTGKTTQTRLWLEHFGNRARVINGDKPLIRVVPDGDRWRFIAYGTPWCGKENMGCNASVPLKALFLLERATEPSCEEASYEYSVARIFHQMLMPKQEQQMHSLLNMLDRLIEFLPIYILHCNMKPESVSVAYIAAQNGEI